MPYAFRLLLVAAALAATSCGAATELAGADDGTEARADVEPGASVEVTHPPEEPTVHDASEDALSCWSLGDGWYQLELSTGELQVSIHFGTFRDTGDASAEAREYPDSEVLLGTSPPCEGCSFTDITEGETAYSNTGLECTVTARVVDAMVDATFECEGMDDEQQRWGTFSGSIACRAQPRD